MIYVCCNKIDVVETIVLYKYIYKDQSNLKTNEYGTKIVESDRLDSTLSTITVISYKNYISRSTDETIVQKVTVPKIKNIDKHDSNDRTIKNKIDENYI